MLPHILKNSSVLEKYFVTIPIISDLQRLLLFKRRLKDLLNMYIKLLLERLFKDLFLRNNVYYYYILLWAYNLYLT